MVDGAPSSFGLSGPNRLDLPRKLYLLSPDTLQLRSIFEGFVEASAAAWSPDSVWIAASLRSASDSQETLYVMRATSRRKYRVVTEGGFGNGPVIWSPDGKFLMKARLPEFGTRDTGAQSLLYFIDLPDLNFLTS